MIRCIHAWTDSGDGERHPQSAAEALFHTVCLRQIYLEASWKLALVYQHDSKKGLGVQLGARLE